MPEFLYQALVRLAPSLSAEAQGKLTELKLMLPAHAACAMHAMDAGITSAHVLCQDLASSKWQMGNGK